ncbi:hypothetical protein RI129_009363 [Pyrocoelia pectoralis]|uniref:Uncharacterized protein n=1 Tax=Pyrocoelia pectoralis TaxID=417401 RepID=A0AAN7V987_9COLE
MSAAVASEDNYLIKLIPRHRPKDVVIVTIKEIFIAYLSSSKLSVHALDVIAILQNDCKVTVVNLIDDIVNLLMDGFFYYCKVWPGWRKKPQYLDGEISFNLWHKQFIEYLSYKCTELLEKTKKYCCGRKSTMITAEAQTEETNTSIDDCPYKLVIGGHPTIINNIAILTRDENIYIKQHPIKSWVPLTVAEFVNWPFVAVELKILDMHFERVNAHNFTRYITIDHSELNITDTNFITHIKKNSILARSYTYVYFKFYIKQLFEVLSKISLIDAEYLAQLKSVCEQFLEDIKEMNINDGSMQSHTTVRFHIGNFKYYRQKQIVTSQKSKPHDNQTVINLVEIIVPEVVCTLHKFNTLQDLTDTSSVTFKSLNILAKQVEDPNDTFVPSLVENILLEGIVYHCTFCNISFVRSTCASQFNDAFRTVAQNRPSPHMSSMRGTI